MHCLWNEHHVLLFHLVSRRLDLTELVIDLYDGAIYANMKTGSLTPKCVPVLATNFDVEDMDR